MARIVGRITSAGEVFAGLRVVGFEEVQIGFDSPSRPCRKGFPSVRLLGEAAGDTAGSFAISFTPTEPPDGACSFSAKVYVQVFDGLTLVWSSPRRVVTPTVRFDHDLLPGTSGEGSAVVEGTLTACGSSAAGLRVLAREIVQRGFPRPPRPCAIDPPSVLTLGTTVVKADGTFRIPYEPAPNDEDECFFEASVQIEVFDGTTSVFESPPRPASATVRFNHEIYRGCVPGSTIVRVVDDVGRRVPDAQVFANGRLKGNTDSAGQIFIVGLAAGDSLVARLRVKENESSRLEHGFDSTRNWNYRVYITSLRVTHDERGDDVALQAFTIIDPGVVQELSLSRQNALIGLNIRASVEWSATEDEMHYYRDRLLELSELIYNATDAQFLIEHIEIEDGASFWNEADIRIYANRDSRSRAKVNGIMGASGYVHMNPLNAKFPGIMLHEFGHYVFGCRDEYETPDKEPARCTLARTNAEGPFADQGRKAACLMDSATEHSRQKFCSAHPDNPHAAGTEQGASDCWTTILERFNGAPFWRLRSPTSRGAIVDRLPDSGVPLGTSSVVPSSTDRAESYIPVADWKPSWQLGRVPRPGECPNMIVRTVIDGVPRDGVKIGLHTRDGRYLSQGRTRARRDVLADDLSTAPGELTIRGAHVGDRISAIVAGGTEFFGSANIERCGPDPLEVPMSRLFDPLPTVTTNVAENDELRVTLLSGNDALIHSRLSMREGGASDLGEIPLRPADDAHQVGVLGRGDGDQELTVVATAFTSSGEPVVLSTAVTVTGPEQDTGLQAYSFDGQLEVQIPAGIMDVRTRVLIEHDLVMPSPELATGDVLLAGPYRVHGSWKGNLSHPALLSLSAEDLLPHLSGQKFHSPTVELLRLDEDGRCWLPLATTIIPKPPTVNAKTDHLGIFALVLRSAPGAVSP
jgi:hypothetical protein